MKLKLSSIVILSVKKSVIVTIILFCRLAHENILSS
jgi:hypothetical protein